jgi:hypothetical protein
MPEMSTLGMLRQEDGEFKGSLGYTARHCLIKKERKEKKRKVTL